MLSIIIPTLNEEKYIKDSLDSIKKQIFNDDYEVIVADFDSKDKTVDIAKSFGCKIALGGLPAKGRNEGAKIAKGDIFLFMDGDTILPDCFLQKSVSEFKERNLDIANFHLIPRKGNKIFKFGFNLFFNWLTARFAGDTFPCTINTILVKKEIHQKIGGFDERMKYAEDNIYVREGGEIGRFGSIESCHILFSTRRFNEDGLFCTVFKGLWYEVCIILFGKTISSSFNYKFGHYKRTKNIFKEILALVGLLLSWPLFVLTIVIKVFSIKIKKYVNLFASKN